MSDAQGNVMTAANDNGKRNLTISLDLQTIQKAKRIAARHSISVSQLLTE
jgi:hypothetical protein